MIKLVALDLDDTLLNDELEIPQENIEAIDRAREHGVDVIIATGRMYCRAMPYAQELGMAPDQVMISYNGAMVRRINGDFISHTPLEEDTALAIIKYCQERNWTLNAYYNDQLYVEKINSNVEYYMRMVGADAHPVGDLYQFTADGRIPLTKLLIVGDDDNFGESFEMMRSKFGASAQVTRSKKRYIEITHLEATKAKALARLAESRGLKADQVMVIGDGLNDLQMIQWAGIGVAMANAASDVLAAADFVTKTNNEAGVAHAINRFISDKVTS